MSWVIIPAALVLGPYLCLIVAFWLDERARRR
jgi:hypothetical protein